MLCLKSVRKSFTGIDAVRDLSFCIGQEKVTGLLGPNGAGKTTTIRMIMNIIKADSGTILYDGEPFRDISQLPGYLPEERGIYQKSEVLETLRYFARLRGISGQDFTRRAGYWLERFQLSGREKSKIKELSKGNQQKIQLILAFMPDPEYLILDEPFTGLDPANQLIVREVLREYVGHGKGILLSTHQLEIAEKLCDHICLIHQGRLFVDSPLDELKKSYSSDRLIFRVEFPDGPVPEDLLENQSYDAGVLRGDLKSGDTLQNVISLLNTRGRLQSFNKEESGLEEIFIRLTRGDAHE